MNLRRSVLPGASVGLLTILLLGPPSGLAQSADAPKTRDPAASRLRELQDQIEALSSEVHAMKAEVEGARAEAAQLRSDLQNATSQLQELKGQLAQTPTRASTAATASPAEGAAGLVGNRVSKIEEDQQLLHSEVDTLAQTKVESGSRYRVKLSGMALFTAFSTRGDLVNYDLPTYAEPHPAFEPNAFLGATLRQSILGLDVYGPEIAGATTRADIRADFFGGFPNAPEGVTAGIMRLRTAGLHFDWRNTSVVVGQYEPLISPLSPTSLVSTGYPALAAAGNLWVWTPEAYIEHRFALGDRSKFVAQGGIMDSLSGQPPMTAPYRDAQPGEQSGQPAYAAHVAWSRSSEAGPVSIGVGGYYAPQNWGWGLKVTSYAVTADWNAPLDRRFALSGEFYHGRALGGLGAAEGQSIAATGDLAAPGTLIRGLNSTGGWAQLKFMATNKLEFNGAFGEDFSIPPGPGYLPAVSYLTNGLLPLGRNESEFVNTIYHLRSNLMFSTEYRRLRTAQFQPGISTGNVVSLGAAALF